MEDDAIEIRPYNPDGVSSIIATESMNDIGLIDETTVLKYPHLPHEPNALEIEEQILQVLGCHRRIINIKGEHDEGILLERAFNGSAALSLQHSKPGPAARERLRRSAQAAAAISYIHSSQVLHRDINRSNLLLDENLHIRLSDFQGRLLNPDGTIQWRLIQESQVFNTSPQLR
ncbi:MAG: hypothetical protein M1837_003685 [Sclerophora amabilis]|nr:MAG: hypothetical protein M1837_003685 [Sclerophora amabilis]